MLRACCLLALLLPAASAQDLQPFTVGVVGSDSTLSPLFHFDGREWADAFPENITRYELTRWEVLGDTVRVAYTNDSLRTTMDYWGETVLALATSWTGGKANSGLAFSPATPPGWRFVKADTTAGSRILRHALAGIGGRYRGGSLRCNRVDREENPLTHCVLKSGGRWPASSRYQNETAEVTTWFIDERQPVTNVRLGDPEAKIISDYRTPLFYFDHPHQYVIGYTTYWEGEGFYVARLKAPPHPYGTTLDTVLKEN